MDVKVHHEGRYRFGPFVVNPANRELFREGVPITLTYRLFETLLVFLRNPNRIITKDELLEAVWPGRYIEESSLTQAIYTLRKALEAGGQTQYIVTAPGRGYSFAVPVEHVAGSASYAIRAAQLENAAPAAPVECTPSPALSGRKPYLAAVGIAAGAAVCAVLGIFVFERSSHETIRPASTAPKAFIATDFENLTGEPVFQNVLGNVVEIDLAQSPFLQMLSHQQITDTLALMAKPPDAPMSADTARKVCMRNGGGAVVGGSISKLDSEYLLTVTVTDCISGRVLAGGKAEAQGKVALVRSLDRLASQIRAELGESAQSIQKLDVPLLNERTASFDALVAFSRGVNLYDRGRRAEAVPLFKHAIALDPNFTTAYAHLAAADYALDQDDEAATAIATAYTLRDGVNEHERLMIAARYHENVQRDLEQTLGDYRLWTEMYPHDAIAWADLANAADFVGRNNEAIIAGQHAVALNPKEESPFVILMRAYMRAGRIVDALAVGRTIVSRHLDGDDTHRELLELAYLRHDARGMAEQVAWMKGKPAEQRLMLMTQGLIAYSQGKIAAGETLFAQSAALGRQLGLHDPTTATRANLLVAFGFTAQAKTLLAQIPGHRGLGDYLLTTAEIGDETLARSILSTALAHAPSDTVLHNYSAPVVRAALDLRDRRPQAALADLVPAAPYERRGYDVPYLRGAAYLAMGDGRNAAKEYRKITDRPGINPISTLHTLAFLGLARASRLGGDIAESRQAYESFLSLMNHADSDVPALSEAKAEYAKLQSPASSLHGG